MGISFGAANPVRNGSSSCSPDYLRGFQEGEAIETPAGGGVMECVEMQAIELSQKMMVLLNDIHSEVAINAVDICRILIRERDFNSICSQSSPSEWKLSQESSRCDSKL